MIKVTSNVACAHFGSTNVNVQNVESGSNAQFADRTNSGRLRSRSLCSSDEAKHSTGEADKDRSHIRPRSRSFYACDTDDEGPGHFSRSNAIRPRARSLHREDGKRNTGGTCISAKPPIKRPKGHSSRWAKKDLTGNKGSLKGVPMMTISEVDNWEISSSARMKYGQYVDWEKIDPEAAIRYRKILLSDHYELKAMGRTGFWSMPHTLRAKAYQHIIHNIESTSTNTDVDTYHALVGKLFGEFQTSTHPFPKFMEDGEIPRYCLNKAGLNSVKKILICINHHFPDVTFCPILSALVSLLLHFSEDEAQCFHSMCSLVTYTDSKKRYIDQTFLTSRASCMTFGDLANKYCRGIRKLIASSHQNLFEFYSDWIMWIFADLPFAYAIRVLDVYLMEGYKVLYRVALALLSLYKVSVSSRVAHVDDFRQDMKSFVENVARHSTIDALLQRAFKIQLPTRNQLTYLFNANKHALIHKDIHNKSSYQAMDFQNFSSSVVTETEMRVVWAWIPERFALFNPVQLFSTNAHGRSLSLFYSKVEGHDPTVLLLKTADEELRPGMERYQRTVLQISGMSEKSDQTLSASSRINTHVDRPTAASQDQRYKSSSFCTLSTFKFMAGDDETLFIGGDGGHALNLQADLTAGYSESCDTFESPPLCRRSFKIQSLEVWGIQHSLSVPPLLSH
ncbi:TBC1 domain family member 24-like isoform X2 [Rhinichthys klamathensis goyatoka]|uniref:TBC1 domain family member 24-like isoform X2 n=1 Tax=Rhinichthys klamathensis goyatoka TaxID=3034132 RepID=UPI0024B5B8A5|nr:TBC1 domain family member 24-like isoform X2 [Rhinichthys klamathensis goyatoka]